MQTRRDQLQAYRFVTRRIVSALLSGEPETNERPMRRFGLAVFGSTMVAVIVVAAVGVYGLIFPSGANLPDTAIVIERETGARYVYIEGELHPVVNFASARLLLGTDNPAIMRVSQQSLKKYPRGRAVGIANLPDPLPDRAALGAGAWSACSLRRAAGSADLVTNLIIGADPAGGTATTDNSLLLEQDSGTTVTRWLVMGGRRMRMTQLAFAPLGMAAAKPIKVTNAVIDALPLGPDLDVPRFNGQGSNGPAVAGKVGKIGQIYFAAGQHYLLLDSGLSAIGPVMRDMLLGDNRNIINISAVDATAARSRDTPNFDPPGFPTVIAPLVFADKDPAMVCAVAKPPANPGSTDVAPVIEVHDQLGSVKPLDQTAVRIGPDGVRLADRIDIAGGQAALVRTLPAPGDATPNTTTYLVTDQGVKYALPRTDTDNVLKSLGYGGIAAMPVPTYMLALVPVGPTLDPAVARQFITPEASPAPSPAASGG
jgi:type VII secretion protein EccB